MTVSICARNPVPQPGDLLASFRPPPLFDHVSFANYLPDKEHPSQAAALSGCRAFSERIDQPASSRWRFRRAAPPELRPGLYLDGGFGVGKTHLLAALWHSFSGPKVFGTFVEYTNLVGAMGFAACRDALSEFRLICIDEFELDDPGDTVLMSTLLTDLTDRGVRIAATSNTLPDRLGEGRFAAEDFLREIQGLSAQFEVLRIDGDDYRHRDLAQAPVPLTTAEFEAVAARVVAEHGAAHVSSDRFLDLVTHLRSVHPSRYGLLVAGLQACGLTEITALPDQAAALRFVVLVDRLYDRNIPVFATGAPVDQVFPVEFLQGGYRKKYYRALSRLVALARLGSAAPGRDRNTPRQN